MLTLTAELELVLNNTNQDFNSFIRYQEGAPVRVARLTDKHFTLGDCNTFAISKLEDLVANGVDYESLWLAECQTSASAPGHNHIVLWVETTQGVLIGTNRIYLDEALTQLDPAFDWDQMIPIAQLSWHNWAKLEHKDWTKLQPMEIA